MRSTRPPLRPWVTNSIRAASSILARLASGFRITLGARDATLSSMMRTRWFWRGGAFRSSPRSRLDVKCAACTEAHRIMPLGKGRGDLAVEGILAHLPRLPQQRIAEPARPSLFVNNKSIARHCRCDLARQRFAFVADLDEIP